MKKRILSILLALIMVVGLLPAAVLAAETEGEDLPFTDVPKDAWYIDAVRYVYENGLMIGTGETTFSPEGTITRAMIVTILHRLEGKPAAKGMDFSDVPEGKWYTDGVAWASANGIVNGFPEGTFQPNDPITREQLVTTLYRYAQFKEIDVSVGEDTNILSYNDVFDVGDWAMAAMQWACGMGILPGTEEGYLSPAVPATRAETAVVFTRLLNPAEEEPQEEPAEEKQEEAEPQEEKDTVTVRFDLNDGTGAEPQAVEVVRGEKVKEPKEPHKPGHEFRGWFTEPDGGSKYNFSKPVTSNMTLYARYSGYSGSHGSGSSSGGSQGSKKNDTAPTVTLLGWNPYKVEEDTSPVYFDPESETEEVVIKNEDGEEVTITEDSVIDLEISLVDKDASPSEVNGDIEEVASVLAEAAKAGGELDITYENLEKQINYVAVDVDMTLITTTVDEETGEETVEKEIIHPVVRTKVDLTRGNLGLSEEDDLTLFTFFASHKNIDGEEELVPGEVVEVGGVQMVRFILNGLSRIVIGNVPPLTVTFDTDGGTPIPDQKVKLGGYAQYVEPPHKDGYVFIGWNFDYRTTNIVYDTTVKALYIEGTEVTKDQITSYWLTSEGYEASLPDEAEQDFAQGVMTVTLYDDQMPSSAFYCLSIMAPEYDTPVAAYVTAKTAESAIAAGEYTELPENRLIGIGTLVSDDSGTVYQSNTSYYIKWVDAAGNILGLQSIRVVVRISDEKPIGDYDTVTTSKVLPVDRGIGTYEFFLTDGVDYKGGSLPDYVAYINGYLNSRWENNEPYYYLYLYGSFQQTFYQDNADGVEHYISYSNYQNVRVEITPFEDETFAAAPTVDAYVWDNDGSQQLPISFTSKLEGGKAILTCPRPVDNSTIYLTVTSGSVTQTLSIEFWGDNSGEGRSSAYCFTWDQVFAEVAKGTDNIYVYFSAEGDNALTRELTLAPNQNLVFFNRDSNNIESFTIGNGGVLTLEGNEKRGAMLQVYGGGSFTVESGGILTTNSQTASDRHYYGYVYVNGGEGAIDILSGGKVIVPDNGNLELYCQEQDITFAKGSTVTTGSSSNFETYTNTGLISLGGSVTVKSYWYNYGTTTVEEDASILFENGYWYCNGRLMNNGTITFDGDRYTSNLNGRFENNGTLTLKNGNWLNLYNTGYTDINKGTINIDTGTTVALRGLVLLNTGVISGGGQIWEGNSSSTSEYDNGIEYAPMDENLAHGPNNYDRYRFVRDPADTVREITFYGKLDDQGTRQEDQTTNPVDSDGDSILYVPELVMPSGYNLINGEEVPYYYIYVDGERTRAYLSSVDASVFDEDGMVDRGFYHFEIDENGVFVLTRIDSNQYYQGITLKAGDIISGRLYAMGSDGVELTCEIVHGRTNEVFSVAELEELLNDGYSFIVDYMFTWDNGYQIPVGVMYLADERVSMLSDNCPVGETRTVEYYASEELTSGTSTIHSFKAEKLDSQTIRFTMEYTVPAGLNYSIFNPPDGDRFMQINTDGTSGEKSTMVFDLSISDLAAVSDVTIKFFGSDDNNNRYVTFRVNEL